MTTKKKRAAGRKKSPWTRAYQVEFRQGIVRLFLEEGYSTALNCEEFGTSKHSIQRWVAAYRQQVIEGLQPNPFRVIAGIMRL